MSAGLSDVERGHAFEHFTEDDTHMGRCYLEPDVERIIAARLAEVEAERDSLVRLMLAANSRAEEANTALADLRAAVEVLADEWLEGVSQGADHVVHCKSYDCSECSIAACNDELRALLAQQHDGGDSDV